MIRVDDLLGKHFAVLGTTGTGKSAAAPSCASIRSTTAAHVVLIDSCNERDGIWRIGRGDRYRNTQPPFGC
jgi:DNA helicase HerA-like ATPase